MVWGLFAVEPLSGEEKYYIYAKGTYKVGRKGCDVTLSSDKGVSRVHAEIVVDEMESFESITSIVSSKVRIRDCSKYGTFVVRTSNIKERVHECPSKETSLKDGDLVSFGTGNASYRFSYVPLMFYLCNFTSSQGTPSTQDRISSIGACVTHKWTTECTHVIVDPFMPVTEGIIDAVLSKKPLVLSTWLEFVAASRIRSEIPSYTSYIPTLTLDGASVTVADSRTRENCLKGYNFVLDSENKYKFQDKMQSLLEVAGAKVLSIEDFDLNSQDQVEAETNRIVLVKSAASADHFHTRGSLFKVNEIDLISAVISGYLDPSTIISPSIVVSSSCSTGETVVADSDAETETETAISGHPISASGVVEHVCVERERLHTVESCEEGTDLTQQNKKSISYEEAAAYESKAESHAEEDASSLGYGRVTRSLEPNRAVARMKDENMESGNLDILYSQNLIVRTSNPSVPTDTGTRNGVVNFKRFRKTMTQSGNSFNNLIPFSKCSYTDSDYDQEISEYVKEEKKRKQMEAMADDLFNSEKKQGRRGGVAGALRGLLGHR